MAFFWPVRVYYEDTDSGGVVYHSNYVSFMERARTEYLRAKGISQAQLINEHQLLFAVRHVSAEYIRPARFDELLAIKTEIQAHNRLSLQFRQEVYRVKEDDAQRLPGWQLTIDDNNLLCEGLVKVVALDSQTMQPKRMPQELVEEMTA